MNEAKYKISYLKIANVLKEFDLFRMAGIKSDFKPEISNEFKKLSLKPNYLKTYQSGLKNYDFNFLLSDESFLQFEYNTRGIRYAFFQNPLKHVSLQDFIVEYWGEEETFDLEIIEDTFREEYEQYLREQEIKSVYSIFRYDYDEVNYKPLIHSASHMHYGYLTETRVPINKIISPLKFILFVVKQVYFQNWKNKIQSNKQFILDILNEAKIGESNLPRTKWTDEEMLELSLE